MPDLIRLFSTSTAMLVVLAGTAAAADFAEKFEGTKPAVSGFNGKLDLGYIHYNADSLPNSFNGGYAIGSLSIPVGHSFGAQIDAGYMGFSESGGPARPALGGIGAHAFWRNPDIGLVGLYGHYVNVNSNIAGVGKIDTWRVGSEAELYLGRVSLEGFAGADIINNGVKSETFFNGEFRAAYYFTDNFRVHAGLVHQFDQTMGRIGGEVLLPFATQSASLYASGTFGEHSTTVRAGLRIYFGGEGKSLINRHREDDPDARLLDFFALGGAIDAMRSGGGGGSEEGGGGSDEGGGDEGGGDEGALG